MNDKGLRLNRPLFLSKGIHRALVFCTVICATLFFGDRDARADALDIALNALAAYGASVGIPISPTEIAIIKPLVKDIIDGKPVAQALRDAALGPLIKDLPADAQNVAKCIAGGNTVAGCGIQLLPKELQSAANCVGDGKTLETCARDEVIKRLPEEARPTAKCLADGTDPATCAERAAQQKVAGVLSQLERRARDEANAAKDKFFQQAPSAVQNIVNVVMGIQDGDWQKVLENGGAAVTKYVVDSVLTPLLPPGTMALVGPILNTMVENRIDLVNDLINAAKRGDVAQAAQVVTEAYLVFQVEVPCTLLGEVIPGLPDSFKEATCGTVGKIIGAVGGAMNDVVQYVGSLFSSPEKVFDLPSDAWAEIGHIVTNTNGKCVSPTEYYAYKFATCYAAGESKKLTDAASYGAFSATLEWNCHRYFEQCMTSDKYRKICGGLQRTYDQQENQLDQGVRAAAAAYAREVDNYIRKSGTEICDPGYSDWAYNDFIRDCSTALNRQIPIAGASDDTIADSRSLARNCVPAQMQFVSVNVADQACRAAVSRSYFERIVGQRKRGSLESGQVMRVCLSDDISRGNAAGEVLKRTLPAPTTYSLGDPLPLGGSRAARAILGDPVPQPSLSMDSLMPTNRRPSVREIDPIPTKPEWPWWKNLPDPAPFAAPSSSGFYGSYSPSNNNIRPPVPSGNVVGRPPMSSSGAYPSYTPKDNVQQPVPSGSAVARPPMSSSGASMSYTPKDNVQPVPSGSAVARPPMSSSGASMSYTPKDNAQPVPSGSAVARPPMSSSGASMSYTPKDGPQPSGSAVPKQTSLPKTDQIQPTTTIRKIRPIHRSGSAAVIRKNMPAVRQLGPANTTVLRNSNSGAAGAFRGTRLRPGDPR